MSLVTCRWVSESQEHLRWSRSNFGAEGIHRPRHRNVRSQLHDRTSRIRQRQKLPLPVSGTTNKAHFPNIARIRVFSCQKWLHLVPHWRSVQHNKGKSWDSLARYCWWFVRFVFWEFSTIISRHVSWFRSDLTHRLPVMTDVVLAGNMTAQEYLDSVSSTIGMHKPYRSCTRQYHQSTFSTFVRKRKKSYIFCTTDNWIVTQDHLNTWTKA